MENSNNKVQSGVEQPNDTNTDEQQPMEGRREAVTKLAYASPVIMSLLFSKRAAAISPPPPPG